MKRREFITLLGGAAVSSLSGPLTASAQQQGMPVVGFMHSSSPQAAPDRLRAFHRGLKEIGYVEGQNVAFEYCWAEGHNDRLPALAADLVKLQVTVIAATTTPAALAAQAATTTIPIVFETGSDPIQLGLVASLNQPGGNVTGATSLIVELAPKRLELLLEVVPTAKVMALLINPADRTLAAVQSREVGSAARRLGLEIRVLNASSERDFDAVFASLTRLRAGGLVIGAGSVFVRSIELLAALTVRHAVPAIHEDREFPAAGGLMGFGADVNESYRLAGAYTGRILKGDKPADLPVQQPAKFGLYVNLKTARTLGLEMPASVLARADELIE
jgi:putative tryptophan/tyrosine transport system substrate-binding protein